MQWGLLVVTKLTLLWNPKTSHVLGKTDVAHENSKRRRRFQLPRSEAQKSSRKVIKPLWSIISTKKLWWFVLGLEEECS